jgi:SWI/SNF-related matrix-associated actin-dependent regulator of chromatin subfamily A3
MLSNEHPKEPTIDEEVQFWIQKEDQTKKILYFNTLAKFSTVTRPNLTRGGILADDMGLGKTIQMIALIASKPAINLDSTYSKTTLIIAPLSVLENWVDQINMHVKKGSLSYYVFHGIDRNNDPEFLKNYDIIITTYTILAQSDIKKERSGLFAIKWLRVILDEGHIIRTRSTKQSIAVCNLDAERRWILTGTPIMNELNDIYSLIKFLKFTSFDSLEIWNSIFNNQTIKFKDNINLRSLIKTVCLCRTKDMKFNGRPIVCLPPINFYTHKIKFKTDEKKIYDKMESNIKEQFRSWKKSRNGNLKYNYVTFLEMLLRLRQICNHTELCKR